jgi:hypothetical protein
MQSRLAAVEDHRTLSPSFSVGAQLGASGRLIGGSMASCS